LAELSGLHESAKLYPAVCDFSAKEGVDQLLKVLDEEIKAPLDVVVNNLGIFESKKFEDITDDEWFNYFNVNVRTTSPLDISNKPHMASGRCQ
jgi:NAD(P)-dependent dehydrogenase (short-subunit alcohol dehydrogenase family)